MSTVDYRIMNYPESVIIHASKIKVKVTVNDCGAMNVDPSQETPSKKVLLSVVVPSLSYDNCVGLIENIKSLGPEIVFIVREKNQFAKLHEIYDNVKILETKSRNFSYLRNFGGYFSSGEFVLFSGDDERLDDELLSSLIHLKTEYDVFYVTIEALFSQKPIRMWRKVNARIIRRNYYHFIGMVHERFSFIPTNKYIIGGTMSNNSYEDWHHYWSKNMRITLLEEKNLHKILLRTYFPLIDYIFNGGIKEGTKEIKVLIGSILYAFLTCVRGYTPKAVQEVNYEEELERLEAFALNEANEEESRYILYVIHNLKENRIPSGSTFREELLQLTSSVNDILSSRNSTGKNL